MIVKRCAKPGCPNQPIDHGRCAVHSGRGIYRGDWPRYSRQRRQAEGCALAGQGDCSGGLTVDHGSNRVLCRSHHGKVEKRRQGYGGSNP